MILKETIIKWTQENGETWFIKNLPNLVIEIRTTRDFKAFIDIEEYLWGFIDVIDLSPWSTSTQLTFVELAMDISLLIGGGDLFNEFFNWFQSSRHESLHRHKAAKIFLNSLNSSSELQGNIIECHKELEASLSGDVDLKWVSISMITLVDIANRYLPLSSTLPETLRLGFFDLFENCGIEWFVDDLFQLNANDDDWNRRRNEILEPWYNKFLAEDIDDQVTVNSIQIENGIEHIHLLNAQQITLPLRNLIHQAKSKYQTLENQNEIWKSLERGTALLSSADQLDAYLASYGTKHIAKLKYILESDFGQFSPKRLVDWGCGQGIGALSLLDKYGREITLKEIILIEPSNAALCRADYLVRRHEHGKNKSICSLHGYFDHSTFGTLKFSGSTIHMFSNILDMESIDLENLHKLICSRFTGRQLFFLISPFMSRVRSARLNAFQNLFSRQTGYSEHIQIEDEYLNNGRATLTARVFSCTLP